MKPLLHIAFILLLSLNLSAQNKQDSAKIEAKKKTLTAEEEYDRKNYKSEPSDRLIFEVNRTGWLHQPSNISTSWKSIGFNLAFMFDKPIGHSNFSVGYGIGIYSHNYHSNADFVNRYDSVHKYSITEMIPKTNSYTVNRFAQQILEVPLELRFRTKTISKFKIMVGGKFGYVVNDFRKVFDDTGKRKFYDTKNVNYLRYGVVFRIGFEQVCFTAAYYFSDVFVKNRGLNGITPYSFGIAIIPY
jgi:hypothetical protein